MEIEGTLQEALRRHGAGDLAGAHNLYHEVLSAQAEHPDALHLLGVLAIQAERFEEAVGLIERAVQASPENSDFYSNLGVALRALGRESQAAQVLQHALVLNPAHPNAIYNLAVCQRNLGRLDEAVQSMIGALARQPDAAERRLDLAGLLLESGRFSEALEACYACLDLTPTDMQAISYTAMALAQCHGPSAAAQLLVPEQVIRPRHLPLVGDWRDEAQLCAALTRYVTEHPSLRVPSARATTLGRQTSELIGGGTPIADALEALIEIAVREYLQAIPVDNGHPYLRVRPPRWSLTAWGVVLDDGGHQASHVHPSSWVSGVIYVSLPPSMEQARSGQDGWIEFGCVPDEIPLTSAPALRQLAPQQGLMVLFPAYMQHRTIPFSSSTPRVSIAFDARPLWGD